jgi:hypothetical protein
MQWQDTHTIPLRTCSATLPQQNLKWHYLYWSTAVSSKLKYTKPLCQRLAVSSATVRSSKCHAYPFPTQFKHFWTLHMWIHKRINEEQLRPKCTFRVSTPWRLKLKHTLRNFCNNVRQRISTTHVFMILREGEKALLVAVTRWTNAGPVYHRIIQWRPIDCTFPFAQPTLSKPSAFATYTLRCSLFLHSQNTRAHELLKNSIGE